MGVKMRVKFFLKSDNCLGVLLLCTLMKKSRISLEPVMVMCEMKAGLVQL